MQLSLFLPLLVSLATLSAPTLALAQSDSARAAHQANEPSLQEILDKLGYTIDVDRQEIKVQLFVRAGEGQVTHKPVAAFGLPKVCTGGWYLPTQDRPQKRTLWQVDQQDNKRYDPPIIKGGKTTFDPGDQKFGLWVSTAGFTDETVCTEDALQRFVPRFKPDDRHKAHIFPARKAGKLIPNTYLIGWEYSTNNDNQDIVTLVTNVKPVEK